MASVTLSDGHGPGERAPARRYGRQLFASMAAAVALERKNRPERAVARVTDCSGCGVIIQRAGGPSWLYTMAMPVLSMLLASPISPPIAARLLGGQVSGFWVGQIVSRHGLRAGPAGLTRSMKSGDPTRST